MALHPDWTVLRALQSGLQAAGVRIVDSYVSLTEVSEYAKGMPEHLLNERLYPTLPPPGKDVFCFYPMTKRREANANWYATPFAERQEMMYEHGRSGRRYAGQVVQLITGSTGLDDFEWGVTLFAVSPRSSRRSSTRCASTRPRRCTASSAGSTSATSPTLPLALQSDVVSRISVIVAGAPAMARPVASKENELIRPRAGSPASEKSIAFAPW